ncbi:hypothetical protein SLS62_000680 [Diatrype stigma]|uniref:DUF7770 domain-containing protein n=1 Tax=Diatrype stigma TaxID=117547 RepID=A0AAN9VBL9_9PEZI
MEISNTSGSRSSLSRSDMERSIEPGPETPQQTWTMPVQAFKAIHFVPRGCEDGIRRETASEAYAVAHELLPAPGGNHWCFYIGLSNKRFVQIDATPSGIAGSIMPGGQKAYVVVSELTDLFSQEQVQYVCKLSTRRDVTVGDFLDAITQHGREKYEFSDAARGCRYWTMTQIDLFLQLGLISDRAEAEQAKDDILVEYDDRKPTGNRLPLTVGQYYY